jgi:DNA repair exonuclease SbcCD ATPase subunit
MKLKRLIIKNFGIFRGARFFDLDNDLIVFYGENFTGKTTLARAVYFALCGRVLTTGIKQPQGLVSSNEQSATTGAVYTHENEEYRIYRSTKGDIKSEFFQHHQWQQKENNTLILPALNPQQWQIGCFLQEDEIGEFLAKPPATRRDLLNQILGIEQLLSVQEAFIKVRRLAKRLEKTVLSRQSSLRLDGIEDCADELAACRNKVTFLEGKLQRPEDVGSRQRLQLEWSQQKETLQNRLKTLTTEYETLLSGFANRDELRNTLQQVTERLTERDQAIREAEAQTEKRITLSSKLKEIEALLTNFQGLQGQEICPTCLQPLSEEHLHHLERAYQEQCEELKANLSKAEAEEREAREALELFKQLAARETDLKQRVEKAEFLEKDIREARTQLETVETKLTSVAEETATDDDQLTLQRELEKTRVRLKQLETQHALFQEHRQNIETINRQASKATHHRLLSEWVADTMEQTLQAVVGVSLNQVEQSVISHLKDFGLLQSNPHTLDLEKTRLMPNINGRVFHALSGSEKVILYLGMKMAISQLMPGADFVVLDNPTLHLDDIRREQMRDYLLSLIPQKQIIVLTNDRGFADLFIQGKRIDL